MAACATDSRRPSPTLADGSLAVFSSQATTGAVLPACARTTVATISRGIPRPSTTKLVEDLKVAITNMAGHPSANAKGGWFKRSNPFVFTKRHNISSIDKDINKKTRDRFEAIKPSFERLLLEHIRSRQKPGTRYTPLSTRLAMMGTSENDARPYILILCQPSQESTIRRFTRQKIIREMCQPQDVSVPSLEVLVLGNAPKLHLAQSEIEVITDATLISEPVHFTLCGVPISFMHPNGQRRNATFGGIIKVVAENGCTQFLGITAGHILRQRNNEDENLNLGTFEAGDCDIIDDGDPFISPEIEEISDEETGSWRFEESTILGRIIDAANINKPCCREKYYDWALFQPTKYAMNYATVQSHISLFDKRPGSTDTRDILLLSGSSGRKQGRLLSEPGRILLEGGEFIDTFMITMQEDSAIQDGDSGSWVVDALSFEVYGQLIASDVLGGGYVVSMLDIFDDIKSQLGVQSVGLPDFADIPTPTEDVISGGIEMLATRDLQKSTKQHAEHLGGLKLRSKLFHIVYSTHERRYEVECFG
ncbi:hypothetical protein F5Y04DRAFT_266202 [Hypomontagnella monticulosa]|nr:hypothetical protein F5Y04DRAFT_266202 [Hypomontagnella monticulosa]